MRFWLQAGSDSEERRRRQLHYAQAMRDSEFVLCPRGYGVGTLRLFEAMQMARVPVVIADGYAFPEGPDWESFCVVVPERKMRDIPALLEQYRPRYREMGYAARDAWLKFFRPEVQIERLCEAVDLIAAVPRPAQSFERVRWALRVPVIQAQVALRICAREALLRSWRLIGRRCPYAFIPPGPEGTGTR